MFNLPIGYNRYSFSLCCLCLSGFFAFLAAILSFNAKAPASSVPEIECHVHDTAQMMADSGVEANCAVVVARFVARPAFCTTTSIDNGSLLGCVHATSFPAPYPSRYPSPLCNRTAAKITTPDVKNFEPCDDTTPPTTNARPSTAIPGITF